MNRLLFEKTGRAIYISHLDTMALFPRVFLRAGLHVKFTQGMSPHAYVSIALPLSVGMSSQCELLDFTLEEEDVSLESLPALLNPKFPNGIRILDAYNSDRKIKELRYLQCEAVLEYDSGVSDVQMENIESLFQQDQILVEKKTKKGMTETDIRFMIRSVRVERLSSCEIRLDTMVCAQNPSLNPNLLIQAIGCYLPECTPDFSHVCRTEIYDESLQIFR